MIGRRGRPLRFLGLVIGGWVGLRAVMLWPPAQSATEVARKLPAGRTGEALGTLPPPASERWVVAASASSRLPVRLAVSLVRVPYTSRPTVAPPLPSGTAAIERAGTVSAPIVAQVPGLPQPVPAVAAQFMPSRWSGSAWFVARGGAGIAPGALGGQLGGSQAGLRIAYLLDRKHRIALAARVTTPLGSGLREAGLGVEWQPTRLPVRLVAEQRFALSDGHGGPAIGIVGGFGPLDVPLGFRLEAYGQAGAIRRARTEPYADGAIRAAHTLVTIGASRLDIGAGAWGGAQRGASRLDVGPSLGLTLPIAKQNVRLSLDWRERIAGQAHPDSGPALTLGADF